jgi:hypothetical protein
LDSLYQEEIDTKIMYFRLATHTSILNRISFEWTAGQITKKGFQGWFAELVEYHKQNGTVEVLGENKKEPAACQVGKLCKENSHCSADEQEKKCRVFSSTMQDACWHWAGSSSMLAVWIRGQ